MPFSRPVPSLVLSLLLSVAVGAEAPNAAASTLPAVPAATLQRERCPVETGIGALHCYQASVVGVGRVQRFPVMLLPASGGFDPTRVVLFVPGGPGSTGFDDVSELARYRRLRAGHSIVIVEPRGGVYSRPSLRCPETIDGLDSILACRRDLTASGIDLEDYGTDILVADIEAVRRALGLASVVVWGSSYGSKVALEYARRFPSAARRTILDLPYPPHADLFVEEMGHRLDAISALNGACARAPDCARRYGDLRVRYASALRNADAAPLRVPVGEEVLELDGVGLFRQIEALQFDSRMQAWLPSAIDAAARGDTFRLAAILARKNLLDARSASGGIGFSLGLNLAVECPEKLPLYDPARLPEPRDRWPGDTIAVAAVAREDYVGACRAWTQGTRLRDPANRPRALPEALVLTMEFDPGSTPDWGRSMAAETRRSVVLSIPSSSHAPRGLRALACVDRAIASFAEGGLRGLRTECVSGIPALTFVTD